MWIAGGYMATAINDFIQGCVMLVGICVVIAARAPIPRAVFWKRSTGWPRFPIQKP